MGKHRLMGGMLTACGLWMGASGMATSAASVASPWALSTDGTLVIDTRSHLAWDRCVVGMQWNGSTCTGRAQLLTLAQAQALADERWKAGGVRWRLPRVPELRRLVNRGTSPSAVDAALFPGAPADWHWTSTRSVNTGAVNPYTYGNVMRGGQGGDALHARQAWAVDMGSGEGRGDMNRATPLYVRLVRPAPKP
ncbi:MAG: DUF1566 domain-containing protein [Comamonas sp.]|nr:DUF1566 domain-containing protein [Comamonas sp.]